MAMDAPPPRSDEPPAKPGDGWTTFGPPPAKPGLWRLPAPEPAPAPRPEEFGRDDVAGGPVEVEVVGRTGEPKVPRHAEPDSKPGGPRHARPAPATLADSPSGAILAPTSLLPRVVEADPDGRALPPVLDADSWDDDPPDPVSTEDFYARRRPRLPMRVLLVVGLVLLGLGAAVVVPQLFSPGKNRDTAAGPQPGADTDGPPATSGGELIQPAGAGGETSGPPTTRPVGPGTTPASAGPGAPTTSSTTAGPPGPPGGPPPPPGAPFSLTMSAVDTHSYQAWQRQDNVCGGSVVLVGAWDAPRPPMSPAGTLTFSNITVPATGTYNLVITFAITIGGSRNATITVNGTGINTGGSFPSACTGSRTVPANFTKTSGNTIVFSNSSSTAPSIMRIVISKP
jgi:hypothetical protein